MSKLIIKTGTEAEFFTRGRQLARLADQGAEVPEEFVVSFEEPEDLLKLLTTARLAVFRAVKECPGSITAIAERLHRDRSAVTRDIRQLAEAGLLKVEQRVSPGHGHRKEVSVVAPNFRLEAQLT